MYFTKVNYITILFIVFIYVTSILIGEYLCFTDVDQCTKGACCIQHPLHGNREHETFLIHQSGPIDLFIVLECKTT